MTHTTALAIGVVVGPIVCLIIFSNPTIRFLGFAYIVWVGFWVSLLYLIITYAQNH